MRLLERIVICMAICLPNICGPDRTHSSTLYIYLEIIHKLAFNSVLPVQKVQTQSDENPKNSLPMGIMRIELFNSSFISVSILSVLAAASPCSGVTLPSDARAA
jgi:hypothetical protein